MELLEADNLVKSFIVKEGAIFRKTPKTVNALNGVSFKIKKGEIFGLLGPNGAGKTTTIKILSTLVQPTTGDAYVSGHSITKDQQKARQDLGVMLTGDRTLYWKLTGRENLEYFSALYHMGKAKGRERVREVLKLVGLEDKQNTLVENYSTGMRIRLSFGKAILHEAPVILLDEPTMSLDPQSARLIREIIQDLRAKEHAILLTTHYMEEADQLSDRVAVIDQGKIIALAPPSELKQSVMKTETIEIEAGNINSAVVEKLRGIETISEVVSNIDDASSMRGIIKVHSNDGKSVISEMLGLLVKGGVEISNVKIAEPTLEDVFISLTGRALRD